MSEEPVIVLVHGAFAESAGSREIAGASHASQRPSSTP